jgi:hypothetical protein
LGAASGLARSCFGGCACLNIQGYQQFGHGGRINRFNAWPFQLIDNLSCTFRAPQSKIGSTSAATGETGLRNGCSSLI